MSLKSVLRLTALAGAAAADAPAWAQSMCQISLGYAPVVTSSPPGPTAVPGLGMTSIGLLVATMGVAVWRKNRIAGRNGRQFLSVALLASAGLLLTQGADGLVQSVRAAGPYELSNPMGGTLAFNDIPASTPAPTITVTNTSGVALRITQNANGNETGTCIPGMALAPNGSCTTQAVCPMPPPPSPGPPAHPPSPPSPPPGPPSPPSPPPGPPSPPPAPPGPPGFPPSPPGPPVPPPPPGSPPSVQN